MKICTAQPDTWTLFFVLKRFIVFLVIYCGTIGVALPQDNERMVMIYQETVCPAPWIVFQNDTATSNNLKQLLKKESVQLFKIEFTGKLNRITCEACGCLTGRNVEITIRRKDQQKTEALGFKRPWAWMVKSENVCDWTMGLNDEQIRQKLLGKKIRASVVLGTGLSARTSSDCKVKSGRKLIIKVDREDQKRAMREGFTVDDTIKEY